MIKFIGALLVVFACGALALQRVIKKRNAQNAVAELRDMLIELKNHIGFNLEPLPDLIRRLCRDEGRPGGSFLSRLEIGINDGAHRPLGEIWNSALSEFSHDTGLSDQAKKLMEALGENLGKMDHAVEIERISRGIQGLEALLQEADADIAKSEKMVKSLGILFGIFIVILFI